MASGGIGGFGDPCVFDSTSFAIVPVCDTGLDCHGFNCTTMPCDGRCTKRCTSPDECPASIPACDSRIGVCSPPLPT